MKYFFLCMLSTVLFACNVSDKNTADNHQEAEKSAVTENEGQAALNDSARSTTLEWLDPVVQNL